MNMNISAGGNEPPGNAYSSFDEFYRDFRPNVFRLCFQVLGSRADAEECSQKALYIQSEEDRILCRILHVALSQLSPSLKETAVAAWKDGFDYRQAAEDMGLSEKGLRSRIRRCRHALARLIKDRAQASKVEITPEMWYRPAKENPDF